MMDHYFRKNLSKSVGPLIQFYMRQNVTPNQITLGGLILGILAAIFVAQSWFILAIVTWWLGRLLDGTDGIYARETGQSSAFGSYLDIGSDMAAYGAMILGFSVAFPELSWLFSLILFLYILCITTALSLGHHQEKYGIGEDQNRGIRLGAGLAEGGETGIAYTLFCLFPTYIVLLASIWIIVLIFTICMRTILAAKELRDL